MALPVSLVHTLTTATPTDAWTAIFSHVWDICAEPLSAASAPSTVARRDREIASLDLFLASAGWDLWASLETAVEQTADTLADWWAGQTGGRAVLILDALSLRELPWILHGAERTWLCGSRSKSYRCGASSRHDAICKGARIRGNAPRLRTTEPEARIDYPGARTEALGMPWADCAQMVGPEPDWVLWHHWPDKRVHDLSVAGQGIDSALTHETASQLTDDSFWALVERLTTGRRLVITSDHGYAASGLFPDAPDDQAKYLKDVLQKWPLDEPAERPAPVASTC